MGHIFKKCKNADSFAIIKHGRHGQYKMSSNILTLNTKLRLNLRHSRESRVPTTSSLSIHLSPESEDQVGASPPVCRAVSRPATCHHTAGVLESWGELVSGLGSDVTPRYQHYGDHKPRSRQSGSHGTQPLARRWHAVGTLLTTCPKLCWAEPSIQFVPQPTGVYDWRRIPHTRQKVHHNILFSGKW